MRKIQKTNLCDQLINAILDLVVQSEWPPGMKLPNEIELANSFNVSRNIMREALKILENFGILDSQTGVGTFVSDHPAQNVQNMNFFYLLKETNSIETILEMRLSIEPSIAYFSALRATDDDISVLQREISLMEKRGENPNEYLEDFSLHRALAQMCRNSLLESLCNSLLTQLESSLYIDFQKYSSSKSKAENIDTHLQIMRAISSHDGVLAKQLMEMHLSKRIKLINPDFELNPQNRNTPIDLTTICK